MANRDASVETLPKLPIESVFFLLDFVPEYGQDACILFLVVR